LLDFRDRIDSAHWIAGLLRLSCDVGLFDAPSAGSAHDCFGARRWDMVFRVKRKVPDVRYALPFLIQMWLFVSPIIYPLSLVPEEWRWAMWLNP
jgi:hypothetical protein